MIQLMVLRCWAFVLAAIAFFPASAGAAPETKLVLQAAFPVPSVSLAAVYIADQAGFFKEEGLDIEIRFSSGGPQATQITASGGADLALVTIEPAIQGYEKGIRGKAFYRYYTRLPFFIAVPADSPVKTAASAYQGGGRPIWAQLKRAQNDSSSRFAVRLKIGRLKS